MKILLIMDPGIPVPPKLYGGHERLVYLFAEEYIKLGHDVTILAGPDSYCSGKTITFGTNDLKRSTARRREEALFVWKYLWQNRSNYDLVHNFGRLIYLLPILNRPIKKIMTYGRPVAKRGIRIFNKLLNRNLVFTACSNYCVSTGNIAGKWATVYNSIDFSKYVATATVANNAPLIFLGRLDKIKGVHTAIKVAKATSSKLWIGGNIPDTDDNYVYYKREIEPQIENEEIIYLGALNDEQKNHYLSKARALLFPIEWDEPFGMVMIEAMACGTPVIGFNRGAVPEVVDEGVSGFIVNDAEGMRNAVEKVSLINRLNCRGITQERFDAKIIARQYLALFNE